MRDRISEFFTAPRSWRLRVALFAGPWVSLGLHVDAAPCVDLHVGWFTVSFGRLRDCEVQGWQCPANPRAALLKQVERAET